MEELAFVCASPAIWGIEMGDGAEMEMVTVTVQWQLFCIMHNEPWLFCMSGLWTVKIQESSLLQQIYETRILAISTCCTQSSHGSNFQIGIERTLPDYPSDPTRLFNDRGLQEQILQTKQIRCKSQVTSITKVCLDGSHCVSRLLSVERLAQIRANCFDAVFVTLNTETQVTYIVEGLFQNTYSRSRNTQICLDGTKAIPNWWAVIFRNNN